MDTLKQIEEKGAALLAHLRLNLPSLQAVEGGLHEEAVKVAHAGNEAWAWLVSQIATDVHRAANAMEKLAGIQHVEQAASDTKAAVAEDLSLLGIGQPAQAPQPEVPQPDVAHAAMLGE